jgi:hypothetical protein
LEENKLFLESFYSVMWLNDEYTSIPRTISILVIRELTTSEICLHLEHRSQMTYLPIIAGRKTRGLVGGVKYL